MKAQDRIIKDWLTQIRLKKLGLPRFQRHEAWGPRIVNDFLTSVIRGLPVGVCLILEVGNKAQFKYRYLAGAPDSGESLKEMLLDGQQRLTALWRALADDYEDRTYFLGVSTPDETQFDLLQFNPGIQENQLYVEGESRWIRKEKRFPLWADEPIRCLQKGKIPLKILNPDNSSEYQQWCNIAAEGDSSKQIKLINLINQLRNRIENYNIPYLLLPADTERSVAIDVFIKLNTSYEKLTVFDIVVAQVEEEVGESLHDLLNKLKHEAPELDSYTEADRYTLSVAALMQDIMPNERGFLSDEFDLQQVITDWPAIIIATKKLVGLLEEERLYDNERLPTESILAPLAALLVDEPTDPDEKGNNRLLLRKYIWRAFFTGRYDRAVTTYIFSDFRQLKKVLRKEIGENQIPIFDQNQFPLPDEEELIRAGWPKKRDRLARSIFLLSLRHGAIDFADASPISRRNIDSREYHHLYSEALLKEKGFDEKDISRALNCALITWKTNRKIYRKEPIQYLLERAQASKLGETEIKQRLKSHLVDYDSMKAGDYKAFLKKRAELVYKAMLDVCGTVVGGPSKKRQVTVNKTFIGATKTRTHNFVSKPPALVQLYEQLETEVQKKFPEIKIDYSKEYMTFYYNDKLVGRVRIQKNDIKLKMPLLLNEAGVPSYSTKKGYPEGGYFYLSNAEGLHSALKLFELLIEKITKEE